MNAMSPELSTRILSGATEKLERRAGVGRGKARRSGRAWALGALGLTFGLGALGVGWGLLAPQAQAVPPAGPGMGDLWQLGVPLLLVGALALAGLSTWRLAGWLAVGQGDRWLHAIPRKRVPWRLLAGGLVVGAAWFGAHSLLVSVFGLADDARASDVAVVLGNEVLPDGTPHARLRARLDRAAGLLRAGVVRLVLVTGGTGRAGFQEADVMRAYLISAGVPADRILVDRHGDTTFDSAVQARAILGPLGLRSVVLCSQYYHLPRARLAFARAGLGPVTTAHAPVRPEWHEPWSLLREWVGYYAYLLRPYPG
jgi:vancomycin permeability regulator SanA